VVRVSKPVGVVCRGVGEDQDGGVDNDNEALGTVEFDRRQISVEFRLKYAIREWIRMLRSKNRNCVKRSLVLLVGGWWIVGPVGLSWICPRFFSKENVVSNGSDTQLMVN
jgi:hypothetical protein